MVFCDLKCQLWCGCWLLLMHPCLPYHGMYCGGFQTSMLIDRQLCLHGHACLVAPWLVMAYTRTASRAWNLAGTDSLYAWCLASDCIVASGMDFILLQVAIHATSDPALYSCGALMLLDCACTESLLHVVMSVLSLQRLFSGLCWPMAAKQLLLCFTGAVMWHCYELRNRLQASRSFGEHQVNKC